MKPYYDLTFPVSKFILDEPDLEGYPTEYGFFPDGSPRIWGLVYWPEEKILTREFIDFLHSIGIRDKHHENPSTDITKVAVFKGIPNTQLFIHKDSPSTPTNSWGINLSWGAAESEMRWYDVNENEEPKVITSVTNRRVDTYTEDQLTLLDKKTIKLRPTLIRADIPHHGVNHSSTVRWSVSIRDHKSWTWEQVVEYFKPWMSDEQFL